MFILKTKVADSYPDFYLCNAEADPDPTFYFDADPDANSAFYADPDPAQVVI